MHSRYFYGIYDPPAAYPFVKLFCKGGCVIRIARQWFLSLLLVVLLPVNGVQANGDVPEYLTQEGSRTCTLCSATMMLRSCIYINGSDLWQQVTENGVGAYAWTSDGLYWSFSYKLENNNFRISQHGCSGITVEELKAVLDAHPEGVVLYCGGDSPHAVFLSDYEEDIFYCADPAYGYSGSRIPLDQSLLGTRHGGQGSILSAVSAYWYVDSHDLENRGYLRKCKEYLCDSRIRVRWDGYAMSLPATQDQCSVSQRMMPIRCGDYYTAQSIIVNDAQEYWYRVGEDLYISADDAPRASVKIMECDPPAEEGDAQAQEVVPLMLFSTIKIPQNY